MWGLYGAQGELVGTAVPPVLCDGTVVPMTQSFADIIPMSSTMWRLREAAIDGGAMEKDGQGWGLRPGIQVPHL